MNHHIAPDRAALAATGIRKRYRHKLVLDRVSLTVAAGETVALVGENGSGKTTLLQICAGILRADEGSVETRGKIGYCPQRPALLDLLSADEHLVLFGAALGLPRSAALATGRAVLAELRFPVGDATRAGELSGGSRQKLNLALALLGDPSLLLLDEPYQGFDHGSYDSFWEHVADWRKRAKAVLIVTHVLPDATVVDRIVELTVPRKRAASGGEGS
jgi:ABC-2 type transport system ATP-binding protein